MNDDDDRDDYDESTQKAFDGLCSSLYALCLLALLEASSDGFRI